MAAPVQQPGRPVRQGGQGIGGGFGQILLTTALLTIPMLVLSGLLLGLVFSNRVTISSPQQANGLPIVGGEPEGGAYFVMISATRLTTVASWSSTLTPLLPGFVMMLVFFPIASRINSRSEAADISRLPTPYQLNLLLGMSGGGPGALWEWAKYMFWRRREKSILVVRLSAALLTISLLLGYLIWAADTWLHVATTTVLLDQTVPLSSSSMSSFGRQLSSTCTAPVADIFDSCTLNNAGTANFLAGGSEALKLMSNQSTKNQIIVAGLSEGIFSLVTDKAVQPNLDFSATTFANNVSCRPISRQCGLTGAFGAFTPFNCSDAFSGDLTALNSTSTLSIVKRGIIADFFYDQQLTQPISLLDESSNPFYLGIGTIVNMNNNMGGAGGDLSTDPEIVVPVHGGDSFILNCEVEFYEMQYKYVNGTVVWASLDPVNNSIASLFLAPFLVTSFGNMFIETEINIAGVSNTSQQIADKFALSFGQLALAATAGVLQPRVNLQERLRTQLLVARVPMAPLFTLVAANIMYALFGLAIAVAACLSRPKTNNNIRARLSVLGIIASLFENNRSKTYVTETRDLFDESQAAGYSSRVGMLANDEGGWGYATWAGERQERRI